MTTFTRRQAQLTLLSVHCSPCCVLLIDLYRNDPSDTDVEKLQPHFPETINFFICCIFTIIWIACNALILSRSLLSETEELNGEEPMMMSAINLRVT